METVACRARDRIVGMKRALAALLLAVVAWIAYDLHRPSRGDIRNFDPKAVARYDTDMWKAYYAKQPFKLFRQLTSLMSNQYGQGPFRSVATAFHAARAAFVFKEGRQRADYEKALPDLVEYFRATMPPGEDLDKLAKLELEWWIVHRERGANLAAALVDLYAAMYHVAPERVMEAAQLRAEAMAVRDSTAEWPRVADLLDRSWTSLHAAVQPSGAQLVR